MLSIAQQYTIMRRHGVPIGSKAKPAVATAVPAPADGAAGGGGAGGGGGKKSGKGAAKKR
jgi:YidC/Oxa1 family membrane protein insertase